MSNVSLTYDQYDLMEELCGEIHERGESEKASSKKHYDEVEKFPRVADMEAANVSENFDKYYKYLMYYYYNKIIVPDVLRDEYAETVAYIKKLVNEHIEFVDEEVDGTAGN